MLLTEWPGSEHLRHELADLRHDLREAQAECDFRGHALEDLRAALARILERDRDADAQRRKAVTDG